MQTTPAETKPRVQKFAGDIYKDEYFSKSVYYDYFKAFFDGYSMLTYQYAQECQTDTATFMDFFHEFHLNMTRRKTGKDVVEDWFDPYRLISKTVGDSFNKFWFNCFQFGYDVYDSYKIKFDNFVDFGDIYLSFIFNLLSQSINIKQEVENMIKAYGIHDTTSFVRGLGSILKSVLDFNSYETAGSLSDNPLEMVFAKSKREPTKHQRALRWEREKKEAEAKLTKIKVEKKRQSWIRAQSAISEGVHPLVALQGPDYRWGVSEIIQSPFALLIGAMHAFPDNSNGYKCSRNATELRAGIIKGIDFAEINETMSSAQSFYDGFKLFDESAVFCAQAIILDLGTNYWNDLF